MPYPNSTHDIVIEEFDGGNRRGFMLKRNRKGLRDFRIEDAQTIRPRQLTMGELTQSEFPADLEGIFFQETWVLGVGGEFHRLDPNKIQSGIKVDIHTPGVIQPARELRAATLSANPDEFYPTGFAVASPDTDPGDAGVLAELWAFVGSYTFAGGDDNWTRIAEPQNFNIYYKNGVQFGKHNVAPGLNAGTDVADAPFPYIYKDPTTATWTASTLAEGRFKFFALSRDNAGVQVLWGAHNITDTTLTLSGDHDASDTTLTLSADPTGTIAVNDIVMMGAGGSQELMLVTAISASDPHLTVVRQYGSASVDPAGGEAIYLYQPNVCRLSRAPENSTGSWGSQVFIGQDDQPITGLLSVEDTSELLVSKTDGLWNYSYDEVERLVDRNLTPEFRQAQHSGNFLGMYGWNKLVFLPLGSGGMMVFNPSTRAIFDLSFRHTDPKNTAYHGRVLALHGDHEFLFMLLKDNTAEKIYLLQGKMTSFDPPQFSWSPVYEAAASTAITDNQVGLMVESALDDHRRVWCGWTDTGSSNTPNFYPFGNIDDDQTDGFTNDSDVEALLTKLDANLPRVPKRLAKVELESENLGVGGRKVGFNFRVDEENFVTGDAFITSPRQEIEVEHGTFGKIIEVKLLPTQTSVTTTNPKTKSVRITYQIRPDPTRLYPITVVLLDGRQILNGTTESKSKGDLLQLRAWNASPSDVTLFTPEDPKNGKTVVLVPGTLRVKNIEDEASRRPGYEASFILAEVG